MSFSRHSPVWWLTLGLAAVASCADPPARPAAEPTPTAPLPATSPAATPPPAPPAEPRTLPVTPVAIDSGAPFRRLVRELGPDRLTLTLKLNRVDLAHVRAGDTLLVPGDVGGSELDWAPFPARATSLDSIPKLLVVSERIQAFAAYELGHLVYWGPTSTGKRATPTPTGLFFTTWKAKETRSTENDEWLLRWYFNFDNQRGVSFHEYGLPGTPASHACVRLLATDAEWIYRWADQWQVSQDGRTVERPGTPVLVFGSYRFGRTGPWRELATNPDLAAVKAAELDSALQIHREQLPLR